MQHVNTEKPLTYLKVPFQSEKVCHKLKRLAHESGLSNKIRFIFQTKPALSRRLQTKKEAPQCPQNYETCLVSERIGFHCFKKCVVYTISCQLCSFQYVGETMRCAGTRIQEHLQGKDSLVFEHMQNQHPHNPKAFKWKVVAHIRDWYTRTAMEFILARERNLTSQRVRELHNNIIF